MDSEFRFVGGGAGAGGTEGRYGQKCPLGLGFIPIKTEAIGVQAAP